MLVFRKKVFGFTLIELIAVILLMSIISVVVGRALFHGFLTFQTAQNIAEGDWDAFLALERITNDLHTIRSINDISIATSSQLTFVAIDGTSVSYAYSGNAITRNSQTLADGITSD